jgi:hypothetical protein
VFSADVPGLGVPEGRALHPMFNQESNPMSSAFVGLINQNNPELRRRIIEVLAYWRD